MTCNRCGKNETHLEGKFLKEKWGQIVLYEHGPHTINPQEGVPIESWVYCKDCAEKVALVEHYQFDWAGYADEYPCRRYRRCFNW